MKDKYLNELTGKIVLPYSPNYNEARLIWNRSINKYPLIIVYCFNNLDVSNAIKWSIKRKIDIRIRNGGHNYEGFCIGNGVLVIDISCMNNISLNQSNNLLFVEAGVKNEALYNYVTRRGYPFASGTCPTVGVGGIVTGGGWGLSCRKFGLTCDSLLGIEMIDYKGNVIIANEYTNPDLFFACKGAGGNNFGVITSFVFKIPSIYPMITYIQLNYSNITSDLQVQFLDIWQNFFEIADDRITLISNIYNSQEENKGILIRGLFYGKAEEAEMILKPFLKINPTQSRIEYMPFYNAINIIENFYPSSEKFKSMNGFVYKKFDKDEIKNIVSLIDYRPKGSTYTRIGLYALGGQVSKISPNQTAFYYRNARYIMLLESVWLDNNYKETNVKWVNEKFKYLRPLLIGAYINFPYIELSNYEQQYYGCNISKLKLIKQKYDPYNVFHFPQSIQI